MILNFTNHPTEIWGEKQTEYALSRWGEVVNLPFPAVPSTASADEIVELADFWVERICSLKPDAVLCQGEMTLAFLVAEKLLLKGLPVFAASSERKTVETVIREGLTEKSSVFEFVKFREYRL